MTQFNVAAEIKKYTLAPKASMGKSSDGFPEDNPEDEPEDEPDDEPEDEINDKSGNGAEKKSSNGAGREKDNYALTDRSSDKTKEVLAEELKKLHANELSFDYEGANVLRAEYSDGYLEYSLPLERARFCRREYIFPGKFVQSGIKRAGTGPQRPSEELKEQLRILTSGSAERLDTLAELFARLFFRSLPSKYLWRITGPGGRGFSVWLCNLAENKVDDVLFQPNNPDWKYRLIWDYYFNTMIQSSGNFMVSANMKYMKKKTLLQGILGEMPDISECFQPDMPTRYAPLVLWADAIYTKTPDDAFGSIPLREIYVLENICIAKLAPSDELWLKVCFAAYGARIINKKDEEMRISIDDVIANFVSEYCVKNSEADLGCKEFYNALCSYVCVLPFHVELEKGSTNLSAKMESKFGWKKQTNRKKGNIMTFSGIQLDTVKLQKAIEMLKIKRAEEEDPRTKFEKRIARITDAVEWTI